MPKFSERGSQDQQFSVVDPVMFKAIKDEALMTNIVN